MTDGIASARDELTHASSSSIGLLAWSRRSRRAQQLAHHRFGGVAGVEDEVAATSFVGRLGGAVDGVLEAEVVELVEHVLGVVRLATQRLEQLLQRLVVVVDCSPAAGGGPWLEYGLPA
jgi:hypothetical protein